MEISHTNLLERIARVLAGQRLSVNAKGDAASAGADVDLAWSDHLDDATAVLKTMREPDQEMAAAGDPAVWTAMVRTALGESVPPRAPADGGGEPKGHPGEIYQKPLG
jgi:hypothetical protein